EEARPSEVVSGAHAVRNSTPAREMRTARTAPRPATMNASYGPRPAAREEEITTDFIPLMQGAQGAGLDSGAVVRVELPRSALASLGLPVNAERAHERVKADVVVGEDGTARAIRFVR
ncbi:MAG TPA: hypothetical protein VD968_04005, partial [Pyrinomonadaceae bacterium]|nr:hypothetical protein [Pyrinomonadaceae bacterium]